MKTFLIIFTLMIAQQGFAFGPECEFIFGTEHDDAVIAKIHDQNEVCGTVACMAHAAATKIENMIYLKTGRKLPVSVPFLIANAARLRAANQYKINEGSKFALPIFNKIQTAEQDFIFQAAMEYGIVPDADWQPPKLYGPEHDRLLNLKFLYEAPFENILKGRIFNNQDLFNSFTARLDALTGPMPKTIDFEGKTYTPVEFAREMMPQYKQSQVLVTGHENLNKKFREFAEDTETVDVEEAIERVVQEIEKGQAVASSFTWASDYRKQGVWQVEGTPKTRFLPKEFYHGMVIVNYSRNANGQIDWLKIANVHGLDESGKRKSFDGYYYVHRSYFVPYLLRLYFFEEP